MISDSKSRGWEVELEGQAAFKVRANSSGAYRDRRRSELYMGFSVEERGRRFTHWEEHTIGGKNGTEMPSQKILIFEIESLTIKSPGMSRL